MSLKKIIFCFVFFILIFGALPTSVIAGTPKERADSKEVSNDFSVSEAKVEKSVEKSRDNRESKKHVKAESELEISSFAWAGINVSGYVTRPNGDPVANAFVVIGTPDFTPNTPPPNWCTLSPTNQTTTTTDADGYFTLGNDLTVVSGGSTCDMSLKISHDDYVDIDENLTVNDTDDEYPDNETMLMHASLTAAITTNLINDPYSNYNQNYAATVTVQNLGDIAANSVQVNMTAVNGSAIVPVNVNLGTINGLAAKSGIFSVTSPAISVVEVLTAEANGTDADDSRALYANDTYTIYVQQPGGGDDSALNVTDVSLNDTTIETGSGETIQVNATVLNDGEANVTGVTTQWTVHEGNDCTGADASASFTLNGPAPASIEIAGGTSEVFVYALSTLAASKGNYTVCIKADGTDANDGSAVASNENFATFTVEDTTPPLITITSPAGGSTTGPSAFLNATTNEDTICRFGTTTAPTAQMTATDGLTHSEYLTGLANGSHTYFVNCTDASGNNAEANVTWNVDAVGPDITIESPLNTTYGPGDIWANVTTSEPGSCEFAIDQDGMIAYKVMFNDTLTHFYDNFTTTEGAHNITFICYDAYGNSNMSMEYFTMDMTPPDIILNNVLNEVNGTFVLAPNTILNFTLTDVLSNISASGWDDGATSNTTTYAGTDQMEHLLLNTSDLQDNGTLGVWANDTVGNLNTNITVFLANGTNITIPDINFTVDDVAPNVTINEPVNMSWQGDSIYVDATATDDYGVSTVEARWENATDQGNWTTLTRVHGTDDWTGNIDSSNLTEGTWTVRVNATDLAGNYNDTETVMVQIDHTPPAVIVILPADGAALKGKSIVSVEANVSDTGAGIENGTICPVHIAGNYISDIVYDNVSACKGEVRVPNIDGVFSLAVFVEDAVGNIGDNSTSVSITRKESLGGGGGGGGGGAPLEDPEMLELEFTVDPEEVEMLSDETATFIVDIENVGEGILNNIVITTYDLADDEYYTDPEGISLVPGESGTLDLIVSPESLGTGIFKIDFSVGNSVYSEGGSLTLKVTDADEAAARSRAETSCNAAEIYLANLTVEGIEIGGLADTLEAAQLLIVQGEYDIAFSACEEINALTPEEIISGGGGITTPGGITGFFISAGDFTIGNLLWILLAAAIVLGTFVGRHRIARTLVDLKKKKPKMPKLFPKKPVAPLKPKTNGKTNGKANGKAAAPKQEEMTEWEIEWK